MLTSRNASFVLIDPPNLEQEKKLLKVMGYLNEQKVPFMVWTPRIGNSNTPPTEGKEYRSFRTRAEVEQQLKPVLVRWYDKWRSETCGCCLHLFPAQTYKRAVEVVSAIRKKMEWQEE